MMPDPLGEGVDWLREGGLLAYPTETVWGLGADARNGGALERLRQWKGRPAGEPISVLVDEVSALTELDLEVGEAVLRLASRFWPGPLTLVLPGGGRLAVARPDGAVGVRCSAHPLAAALARRLRAAAVGPITATSLNRSGDPPARTRDEALGLCGDGPDAPRMLPIDRAESGGDEPSTVVDLTGERPVVLRWGALPATKLQPVLAELAA